MPEIIENEIDGEPIPVKVTLPVTINGRIFPREEHRHLDVPGQEGQTIRCEVNAARLGSPLDARLEVRDAQGRKIAENDDYYGADPMIAFTAPADGEYQVHIQDTQTQGGQAYVYRLTLTAEPFIERVFPLGGQRGKTWTWKLMGQNVPGQLQVDVPKDAPADFAYVLSLGGSRRTNPVLLRRRRFAGISSMSPEHASPDSVDFPAMLERPDRQSRGRFRRMEMARQEGRHLGVRTAGRPARLASGRHHYHRRRRG